MKVRILAAVLVWAACLFQASAQTRVTVEDGVILIQANNACWVSGSAFLKGSAPKGCPTWEAQAVADGCSDAACSSAQARAVSALKKKLTGQKFFQCETL